MFRKYAYLINSNLDISTLQVIDIVVPKRNKTRYYMKLIYVIV